MNDLVHNERVKLLATLLNTIAVANFVVGALTPFAAVFVRGDGIIIFSRGIAIGTIWIVICFMLHGAARLVLRGLR